MDLMQALRESQVRENRPEVAIGDFVKVHVKVKEGSRERIQVFEGTVIAKKHGGAFHRPPRVLRRWCGENFPGQLAYYRQGRSGSPR